MAGQSKGSANWWAIWYEGLHRFLERTRTTSNDRRGERYARSGRVMRLEMVKPQEIVTLVQGSLAVPYRTSLRVVGREIRGGCSCPIGVNCKHSIAAAMVVFYDLHVAQHPGAMWPAVLPVEWSKVGLPSVPDREDKYITFLGGFLDFDEVELEENKPPAAPEPPKPTEAWWRRLLNARSATEMESVLTETVRKTLNSSRSTWVTSTIVRELMQHRDAFALLDHYQKSLDYWYRYELHRDAPRDTGLAEFLASTEVHEERDRLRRVQVEKQFFDWLGTRSRRSERAGDSIALQLLVKPGLRPVLQAHFELLLSTKTKKNSPRKPQAIAALVNDVYSGKRNLTDRDERLLHWVAQRPEVEAARYSTRVGTESQIPVRNLMDWLLTWAPQGLLHWADGGTVSLSMATARLQLRPNGDHLEWAVEVVEPDGEAIHLPINEAEIFTDMMERSDLGGLFLRLGDRVLRLDSGGMPLELVGNLRLIRELEPARLREAGVGKLLVSYLPRQSASSNATTNDSVAEVPVKPAVELRLETDGHLHVRSYARGAAGHLFGLRMDGTWLELSTLLGDDVALEQMGGEEVPDAPLAEADLTATTLALLPRQIDVEPLQGWLKEFLPAKTLVTQDAGTPAENSFEVAPADLLDLISKWAVRPEGVTYYGNKAFRDLITLRSVPKMKIKIEPSGINWLKVSLEYEAAIEKLSVEEVMAALAEPGESELVLMRGRRLYKREELEEFLKQFEVLHGLGVDMESEDPQQLHVLQLAGEAGEKLLAASEANPRLEEFARRSRELMRTFKGVPPAAVPADVAAHLRPYQRAGVDFMAWATENLGGAVLADDMGLGKTLQVLALLATLRAKAGEAAPSLVICPTSVAQNWRREAQRFTPDLRVLVIERGNYRKTLHSQFADYDLVIMNYALARLDLTVLQEYQWLLVCVDEAQTIKNPDATISRAVKTLNARCRVALTGTPIENRLADLGSIVGFAVPGYLKKVAEPTSTGRGDAEFALRAQGLRARLRPILLRRLKSEVANDLPPRIEERRDCEMNPAQAKLYLAEVKKTREMFEAMEGSRNAGKQRLQILAALMRLRQICCDPAIAGLQDTGSGKVEELLPLVREILESGNKVLVFSQFVKMINRLQKRFTAEGIPFLTLTGATKNRQQLVDTFESSNDPLVFFISLKAGGTGLNLTSASHVILYDPWWNPSVEAQAIDRTHRIGQNRTVVATRLVTLGTIEERILELQEQKRELVANVLDDEAFSRALSREDLFKLLRE